MNAKRQRIEDELARGPVFMYIDARRDGVSVPPHLAGQYMVPILIGYNLSPPINLVLDDKGITAALRFGALGIYACVFPWVSIFAVRIGDNGEAAVWVADVPPELELKPVAEKPKRHLRSV